jgi:APA family basic amino acid/polyamine antiporter
MGEFALIIGWDLVLEYALGAATVAVSWSQYVDKFLCKLRNTFHNTCMVLGTQTRIINLPSILIICLLSVINERHKKNLHP